MLTIELFDAFAAGIYLLFGIIHLDLWRKRRDRAHLWLAGASGGALLVDLTGMTLRRMEAAGRLLPFLNMLGVLVVTVSLFELVMSLGNERSGKTTRALYATMAVLIPVVSLGGVLPLASLYYLLAMVLMLWAMVHATRAGRAGDREARTIAAGLIILILCLVADLLGNLRVIPALPGIPIVGFTALFLLSASALNTRYEREHRELVDLRADQIGRASCRERV